MNNEFTRDAETAPPATPQSNLRDQLIGQYGPHVGAALAEIELTERKKIFERKQQQRTQLAALNDEISAALKAHDATLALAQERMDTAYTSWLAASEAHAAELARRDGSVAHLRAQATDLIRAISAPPPHFANMVRNWSRPADYSGGEEPREFENKTFVHVRPNWEYAGQDHAPPPREFHNVPRKGPGRG